MTLTEVHQVVEQALAGGFFLPLGNRLWLLCEPRREVPWELLGGHVLDPAMTREVATFVSWELSFAAGDDAPRPFLAILWDEPRSLIFVVRYLRVHGWEAYEAEPRVILSRPVEKLARELVGTIRLAASDGPAELQSRLERMIFTAMVGRRLPVTSWESPLPEFQFGQFANLPGLGEATSKNAVERRDGEPVRPAATSIDDLAQFSVSSHATAVVRAKALEAALRAADNEDVSRIADNLAASAEGAAGAKQLRSLFSTLFHHVALTPYTDFAERLAAVLVHLAATPPVGPAEVADIIGPMLRHLVRHLTAFDLRTFHNRGANYPDLLLIDRLLTAYLSLIERHAPLFHDESTDDPAAVRAKQLRRRALRQAWLIRQQYEGLAVPARPTSPGDLQRVLPVEPTGSLPDRDSLKAELQLLEEEVNDPAKRRRRLFVDDPIEKRASPAVRALLAASMHDLSIDAELRELGLATFLDRPLGQGKQPGEIDRTPLLTYEAFSRGIARQRLAAWYRLGLLSSAKRDELTAKLSGLAPAGFSGHHGQLPTRPGVPCLEDANLAEPDFVYLRTTRSSLDEFLADFNWSQLQAALPDEFAWFTQARQVLLIRSRQHAAGCDDVPMGIATCRLEAIDATGKVRFQLHAAEPSRLIEIDGCELPSGGLTLERAGALAADDAARLPSMAVPLARPAAWLLPS